MDDKSRGADCPNAAGRKVKCGLDVSCGWSALEVKVTLTFHVVEVSGDCRRKRSQDSRGKERQRSSDSLASLTTQEAKDPWRGGEAAALR